MKVAYVFITPQAASYKLGQNHLPQLEVGVHGVEPSSRPSLLDGVPRYATISSSRIVME